MNYYWNSIEECEEDLYLAESLSNEDFEKKFNWDAEDREELVDMFRSDLLEMKKEQEEEELNEYAHHTVDEDEAYADLRNFL